MIDKQQIVEKIKSWVQEVGRLQRDKFGTNLEVATKSSAIDLVTEVDEESEQKLFDRINANYPQHSILAEESGRKEREADYLWVVDPLDGTVNYAHGFPFFSISIALQYQGSTQIGVVYAPVLDDLYRAIKGEGAFLNGKQLTVSHTDRLGDAMLATGFPYDRATAERNNVDNFNRLVTQVRGIRRAGSAALDLCQVAAGVFDGFWELKLSLWDIEAGRLIIEEAGGRVKTSVEPEGITLVSGNQAVYSLLLEELEIFSQ